MGDRMWKTGHSKECIVETLTLLSEHHDIETSYERAHFKELDWKIAAPKIVQ
jgi:hypothetical protein